MLNNESHETFLDENIDCSGLVSFKPKDDFEDLFRQRLESVSDKEVKDVSIQIFVKIMSKLCEHSSTTSWKSLLQREDVKYFVLQSVLELLKSQSVSNLSNLISFLKAVPAPMDATKSPPDYLLDYQSSKKYQRISIELRFKRLTTTFSSVWLEIVKQRLKPQDHQTLLKHIPQYVLPHVNNAVLFTDFFMSSFKQGDLMAVLSLEGIFILIHKHNLDYPNFYDQVYQLLLCPVFCSPHRTDFVRLLNIFLSSTHLSAALVAGFIKRLARLCLLTPVDSIMDNLSLIRNLLIRHPAVSVLVDRPLTPDAPAVTDVFNADCSQPEKSNAIDSSLWEIKALCFHYNEDVRKLATKIVDKQPPIMEDPMSSTNFNQIFEDAMGRDMPDAVPMTFRPPGSLTEFNVPGIDGLLAL